MSGQGANDIERIIDGEWPDRLRRGVYGALQLCSIDRDQWDTRQLDVHHIVAADLGGAVPARHLLARWSINVHSIVNAAIVPRSFHQGEGLHRQEFLHTINLRLASAAMFAEAILPHGGFMAGRLIMLETVQKIGTELVARSEDITAIRLQNALQSLVARSLGGTGAGTRADSGTRGAVRTERQRIHSAGRGASLEGVAVSRARRSSLQHAPACS